MEDKSLIDFEGNGICFSSLKVAEDKKGIILRLYNPLEKFRSFKFKPNFEYTSVSLAKLNEEKIHSLKPEENGYFKIDVEPFKIVTFKIEL
jgi:alpha-mannosidase